MEGYHVESCSGRGTSAREPQGFFPCQGAVPFEPRKPGLPLVVATYRPPRVLEPVSGIP